MTVQITHDSSFSANDFTVTTNNNELQLSSDNKLLGTFFPESGTKIIGVHTEYLHPQNHTEPDLVTQIIFDSGDVGQIFWKGNKKVYTELVNIED